MNCADYVSKQVEGWKKAGKPLMWIAWEAAKLCVGWAYVFAALGQYCNPTNRRYFYASKGKDHPTIKTKCQVIRDDKPKDTCKGCKWYPDEKRTRIFDCRGFIYWILLLVYGFKLAGGGCSSQWNTKKNWKAQGTIDTCPDNQLVCLFEYNPAKKNMKHTGFGFGKETVECQVGVQYSKKRSSKWTHWGIPACFSEDYVPPAEKPKEDKVSDPVLKKGASGSKVKELQKLLIEKGYSCGKKGADGKFGDDTLAAVKAFQKAQGLKVDGIVGTGTWKALKSAEKPQEQLYRVIIPGQTEKAANELIKAYKGAYKEKEG